MAPSPSWRRSPGRDIGGVSHKRGRSFDRGSEPKDKKDNDADDLELFSELQRREQEGFLLQSSDDFEDVLTTKLKSSTNVELGINIPVRGTSSDLLNADGEKNDYDWLLTPPESPLFPSLDEEPAPINLVHSGRPRSRSVSVSRSSVMEKNLRSSRGSASPQRMSQSPQSGRSSAHGRPLSAPHSGPNTTPQSGNFQRRPSPTPIRPSTPPPRSATPPPRQSKVGPVSAGVRGTSPVRTGRGNSASPKVRTWQPDILGLSLEAPPNLRTSLADRPASYVRGSSPASRSSKDSSSRFGRRSMSPSTSRNSSSPYTRERDQLSSYTKASTVSSGDDDADSLQSGPVSSSERSVPRRVISGFPNNRPSGFSRKPTKTNSPISAPKRSFDYAIRQMDHKSPQNRFRPLLSSVPSSTFYSGKPSSSHHVMVSMNSSMTTISNASSDQAISGVPDTGGSDQYQDDVTSELLREAYPGTEHEVLTYNNMLDAHDFPRHKTHEELRSEEVHEGNEYESHLGNSEESSHQDSVIATALTSDPLYGRDDSMGIGGTGNVLLCSTCGCRYLATETTCSDVTMCLECQLKEEMVTVPAQILSIGVAPSSSDPLMRISDEHGQREVEPSMNVGQQVETEEMRNSLSSVLTDSFEENVKANQSNGGEPRIGPLEDSPRAPVAVENMQMLPDQLVRGQYPFVSGLSSILCQGGEAQKSADGSRAKANLIDCAGKYALLLQRSSSSKGPILQSRNITASSISFEDSSYARDSTTSMKSSIGYGSVSTSSSVDLTLSRHAETLMQRQLSSTRSEMSSKPQSNESTNSGTSTHASQALSVSPITYGENFEVSAGNTKQSFENSREGLPELLSASENAKLLDVETFLSKRAPSDNVNLPCSTSCREKDVDIIEIFSYNVITPSEGDSRASSRPVDDYVLDKAFPDGVGTVGGIEDQAVIRETSEEENIIPDNGADAAKYGEVRDENSLAEVSKTDIDYCYSSSPTSQAGTAVEDFPESSLILEQDEGIKDSVPFSGDSGIVYGVVEESTVMLEDQGGRRTRSMTLEEATDTILFCSSIIHDLAYQAATIAIGKEKENMVPLEGSSPTLMLSGGDRSSIPGDLRGRTPSKRPAKSQRPKQTLVNRENEPTTYHDSELYEKPIEPATRIVGLQSKVDNKVDGVKPPKLESKCNCAIM